MDVIVGFPFMAHVIMIVSPMFARMSMIVGAFTAFMVVLVFVSVLVQMNVIMVVLVIVDEFAMPMFVRMRMAVLVVVLMFVPVTSLHCIFSFPARIRFNF